jgi:hypothetical protein
MTCFLATLALTLAAPPGETIPRTWEFRDAVSFDGRSLLAYRPIELGTKPPRPLHPADDPGPGAKFGLLPVGNQPESFRLLVWRPKAVGGPDLWIDGDGDGRFGPGERHRLTAQSTEIPITIAVKTGDRVQTLRRTLLIRPTADGGLQYAVRGFVAGRLAIAGREYAALLTDGNGDGCFDSPNGDRIWINLDGDGQFDGLTEQFALGTPVTINRRAYLIRPAADGMSVAVRERAAALGSVRLIVAGSDGRRPLGFSAQLLSDWGELVTVAAADTPTPLPVGRYAIESMEFRLQDDRGRKWNFKFAGARRLDIVVEKGQEASVRPLDKLAFSAATTIPRAGVTRGDDLSVTPSLRTPAGIELIQCTVAGRPDIQPTESEADIRLDAADGTVLDRAQSGFL